MSTEQVLNKIPLIGEKAPRFEVNTTIGKIDFPDHYKGKSSRRFYTRVYNRICWFSGAYRRV